MRTQTRLHSPAEWIARYLDRYRESLFQPAVFDDLAQLAELMRSIAGDGRKIIIAGNGGSAAIASHCAIDFTKQARVRCVNFSDPSLITCLANDYGYDRWLEQALRLHANQGDGVILISSSGKSPNVLNAARYARESDFPLVTFSGFDNDNPLRQTGKINFWVDSKAYNIVEMTHQIWLLAACDLMVGRAEYPARDR